jgi:heme exporter protein A
MPAVEVEDLRFTFGVGEVLKGVTIGAQPGSFVTIFGPNGAGKTTLLKIVAGLLKPSSGAVRVAGIDARRDPNAQRRLIGVISHHPYLYPQLTGRENLEFFAKLYGLKNPVASVEQIAEELELGPLMNREVSAYSRGMQQRLAVGRALLHRPRLLLLDEPFTGLDYHAREKLEVLLRGLNDGERTAMMTTHDVDEGLGLSDRVAVLAGGKIVLECGARDYGRDDFLACYRDAVSRGGGVATGRGGGGPVR